MDDQKLFPPPKHFTEQAHTRSLAEYERLYAAAASDPEKFWAEQTRLKTCKFPLTAARQKARPPSPSAGRPKFSIRN